MQPTLYLSEIKPPEGITFSETRSVNNKKLAVFFGKDETLCWQFARANNGYSYKFMTDIFRVLIPVKTKEHGDKHTTIKTDGNSN